MALLIRTANGAVSARATEFGLESELEEVVASRPDLLTTANDHKLALVGRQIDLPDAGLLDLLFVSEAGLPVAAEVKLARNGESRRQIVAQLVDYLSSLTLLTVDELDAEVDGALEMALRSFDDPQAKENGFERRWQAVGANLRAGLARMILVLDAVPQDLERIARFLTEHTNLDIRVVTVTKHDAGALGTIFSPHIAIVADGEVPPRPTEGPKTIKQELAAIVAAFDRIAPPDLKSRGTASYYRQVRPPEWPTGFRVHYEFVQHALIGVELHLENPKAAQLASDLVAFSGRQVGPSSVALEWDPKWNSGRGRLTARFKLTEDVEIVARTMLDLIAQTRIAVHEAASRLQAAAQPNQRMEPSRSGS